MRLGEGIIKQIDYLLQSGVRPRIIARVMNVSETTVGRVQRAEIKPQERRVPHRCKTCGAGLKKPQCRGCRGEQERRRRIERERARREQTVYERPHGWWWQRGLVSWQV